MYRTKYSADAGFTLIELLLVLSVISIILVISMRFSSNFIERIEMNDFIHVFESDILYIQNAALGTRQNVRLVFREDYYVILHAYDTTLDIHRPYPAVLNDVIIAENRIRFTNGGTIQAPMSMSFKTANETYRLVFPLGKGRMYLAE